MTHSAEFKPSFPDPSSSACHVSAAQLVELCWLWWLVLPASLEERGRNAALPGKVKVFLTPGSFRLRLRASSVLLRRSRFLLFLDTQSGAFEREKPHSSFSTTSFVTLAQGPGPL